MELFRPRGNLVKGRTKKKEPGHHEAPSPQVKPWSAYRRLSPPEESNPPSPSPNSKMSPVNIFNLVIVLMVLLLLVLSSVYV